MSPCQDLGTFVVAEGIETGAEREMLVDLGCNPCKANSSDAPSRSGEGWGRALAPEMQAVLRGAARGRGFFTRVAAQVVRKVLSLEPVRQAH